MAFFGSRWFSGSWFSGAPSSVAGRAEASALAAIAVSIGRARAKGLDDSRGVWYRPRTARAVAVRAIESILVAAAARVRAVAGAVAAPRGVESSVGSGVAGLSGSARAAALGSLQAAVARGVVIPADPRVGSSLVQANVGLIGVSSASLPGAAAALTSELGTAVAPGLAVPGGAGSDLSVGALQAAAEAAASGLAGVAAVGRAALSGAAVASSAGLMQRVGVVSATGGDEEDEDMVVLMLMDLVA